MALIYFFRKLTIDLVAGKKEKDLIKKYSSLWPSIDLILTLSPDLDSSQSAKVNRKTIDPASR